MRMNSPLHAARKMGFGLFLLTALLTSFSSRANADLTVGYSDWPGWVAWEVAIEKDWFAEAGIDVTFEWFDYVASMDAFAAGQLDGVLMTNGDTLVTGATGAIGKMIIIGDYSNGNDMLVAGPDIETVADLKGKKVGVEVGFVGHLLLLNALEDAGLTEDDVELVNVPTNETPQVLASGDVSAIVAWQPSSGQALSLVAGSKALYTSADKPGLIYDVLAVSPQSLAENRDEWSTLVDVWYRVVDFINSDDTRDEALSIMSARVGLSPGEYAPFLEGTRLLNLDEAKAFFAEAEGFDSIWGSTKISDDFNLKYQVYTEAQDLESYIDASLTVEK